MHSFRQIVLSWGCGNLFLLKKMPILGERLTITPAGRQYFNWSQSSLCTFTPEDNVETPETQEGQASYIETLVTDQCREKRAKKRQFCRINKVLVQD